MTFAKVFKYDMTEVTDMFGTAYPLDTQINRYAERNNVQPVSVAIRTISDDRSEALVIFTNTEDR